MCIEHVDIGGILKAKAWWAQESQQGHFNSYGNLGILLPSLCFSFFIDTMGIWVKRFEKVEMMFYSTTQHLAFIKGLVSIINH